MFWPFGGKTNDNHPESCEAHSPAVQSSPPESNDKQIIIGKFAHGRGKPTLDNCLCACYKYSRVI